MTESMIYWITRLDGIHSFCEGFQFVAVLFTALGILISLITATVKFVAESDESSDDARIAGSICKIACKVWIPTFCIATMCGLINTFTPTTKEMIAIKVIPQIASVDNVEKVKEISKDMLDITADWLKDIRKTYINKQNEQ